MFPARTRNCGHTEFRCTHQSGGGGCGARSAPCYFGISARRRRPGFSGGRDAGPVSFVPDRQGNPVCQELLPVGGFGWRTGPGKQSRESGRAPEAPGHVFPGGIADDGAAERSPQRRHRVLRGCRTCLKRPWPRSDLRDDGRGRAYEKPVRASLRGRVESMLILKQNNYFERLCMPGTYRYKAD